MRSFKPMDYVYRHLPIGFEKTIQKDDRADYTIMRKATVRQDRQQILGKYYLIDIRGAENMPDWRREEITRKYNDPRDR